MSCNDLFTFILKIGNIVKQVQLKLLKICNICCYETMGFMWTLQQSKKKNLKILKHMLLCKIVAMVILYQFLSAGHIISNVTKQESYL